jgi:hypothetical protein
MAEDSGGRKWLRCGCLGCLVLVVAAVLISAVLLAVVYIGSEAEQFEDRTLAPEIPVPGAEPDGKPARPDLPAEPPAGPGKLVLDVRQGQLFIDPAAPGEPFNVKARYDQSLCQLEETLDTDSEPWLYHVDFGCEAGGFLQAVRRMFSGTDPEVRVYIPADLPVQLELHVGQGGAVLDLGGLWLSEMDIDFEMGGVVVDFDEPLREPMQRMELRGSMGGLVAEKVGNASPRNLLVDYRMGGMELNLKGQWLQDSEIEIRFRMGGGDVILPDNARVEGIPDRGVGTLRETEVPLPTLRFSATSDMGDLQFRD